MGFRQEVIDFEEEMIDWMTDAENSFWMLTMFPGIGLPLQLGRRGYAWYNYGETMDRSDAAELIKWAIIREAIWYTAYRIPLNISASTYFNVRAGGQVVSYGFRGRGGTAVGQLGLMTAKGTGRMVWRHVGKVGLAAAVAAGYWLWSTVLSELTATNQGEQTWIRMEDL